MQNRPIKFFIKANFVDCVALLFRVRPRRPDYLFPLPGIAGTTHSSVREEIYETETETELEFTS